MKKVEEAAELLAGEIGHRVKNLLQILSALTQITLRSATTTADIARDLTHLLERPERYRLVDGEDASEARRNVSSKWVMAAHRLRI